MFLKKSSQKRKQRGPSCIFYCFNGSAMAESSDLEKVAVYTGKDRKRGAVCVSWPWFQRKKKPLEKTSFKNGVKDKISGGRRKIEPAKFAVAVAVVAQVNTEPDPQTRPEPSSNQRKRVRPEPDQHAPITSRFETQARLNRAALGSTTGLTVIGVTLAVMVFYGRAAAVVSLCACFYLAAVMRQPLAVEADMEKMGGAGDADVDWQEYKKRVVMEGLLDRGKPRVKMV